MPTPLATSCNSFPECIKLLLVGQERGMKALLWFVISLFFALLSCSAITFLVFVLLATSVATLKIQTGSLRLTLPLHAKATALALLLFAAAAFISSIFINGTPLSNSGYGRIIIWLACFFSGIIFSHLLPNHNYNFLKAMIFVLPCTFIVPVLMNFLGIANFDIYIDGQLSLFTAHPSRLAVFCVFALVYACSFLLQNPIRKNKLFSLCTVIIFVMLLMTVSRAIVIAFPLAIILTTLLTAPAKLKKVLPAMLVTIVLIGGFFICLAPAKQTERLTNALLEPQKTETFLTRLPIWEAGWSFFENSPVWGHGLKSYKKLYEEYISKNKKQMRDTNTYFDKSNWHPHNVVLGRLVDTGLAGTIPFFAFYFLTVICALILPPSVRWTGAFLVFYFLIGMVDDPLARLNDSFVILLAGLISGFKQYAGAKKSNNLSQNNQPSLTKKL